MNFWTVMNGVAWALSGGLFLLILWDFIKVERARRAESRAVDAADCAAAREGAACCAPTTASAFRDGTAEPAAGEEER